jgi:hypothetical protein
MIWRRKKDQFNIKECSLALQAQHKKSGWYVDKDCSNHLTGDKNRFMTLNKERYGSISFGNDNSTIIIGRGTMKLGRKDVKARNVLLVQYMKHNILSVSQMCDQGHKILFDSQKCEMRKEGSRKLVSMARRTPNNIYVMNEIGNERWFVGKENEIWLWHRRMGHINFDNLVKINRKKAVK